MEIRNAVYVTADQNTVDCEIEHPTYGWIPTTVQLNGSDDRPDLVDQVRAGSIGDYVAPEEPPVDIDALGEEVRAKRDKLLSETDWYMIRQLENGTAVPTEVASYRQMLRDITDQTYFPTTVVWPVKPAGV